MKLLLSILTICSFLMANEQRLIVIVPQEAEYSAEQIQNRFGGLIIRGNCDEVIAEVNRLDKEKDKLRIVCGDFSDEKERRRLNRRTAYLVLPLGSLDCATSQIQRTLDKVPLTDQNFPVVDPQDAGKIYDLLMKVQKIFQEHNFTYWACGGTLLGAIRHQGLIPWDDDLDFSFFASDTEKLLKLEKVLNENGLGLYLHPIEIFKIYPLDGEVLYVPEHVRERHPEAFPNKIHEYRFPFIDLFPVIKLEDGNYHHKNEWARNRWPEFANDYYEAEFVQEPFFLCPFGPTFVPVSRGYQINLKRQYGQDCLTHGYIQLNHKTELSFERVKVKLTPGRKAEYILPNTVEN